MILSMGTYYTGWYFEQIKVHKSRKSAGLIKKKAFWEAKPCDRIVEDDIVCGHLVTDRCFEQVQKAEKSAGLI